MDGEGNDDPIERDAAALRRIARGDRKSFEALHAEHYGRVVRLAMGITLDHDEARDVAQDVFIRLLDVAPHWRPNARVSTWLHRTTLNVAASSRRKVWRWLQRRGRDATADVSPERRSAVTQAVRRIEDDLAALSPGQRAAVTLHLDLGMQAQEIARELGITSNAARMALSKGLRKLRAAWNHDDSALRMKETTG